MNKYERFDKYFQYSYINDIDEKIGVFRRDTPKDILEEAEKMFDVVEIE